MLAENPDVLLGIKVRETLDVVGTNGLEPLKRAIAAAERSGVEGARVMCHIGNAPGNLSELLDLLRPGDVLTHAYSGAGNNTVVNGKVLDAALAAKRRGVLIDVGHGGGSFDYTVCEAALQQGFAPDIISSDVHAVSVNTPGKPFLPWVMSKFLNLGMPLEQVVTLATAAPAKAIGRVPKLGTLQVGAPADLSMVEIVEARSISSTPAETSAGPALDQAVQTVKSGPQFGRPYPQPFGWRNGGDMNSATRLIRARFRRRWPRGRSSWRRPARGPFDQLMLAGATLQADELSRPAATGPGGLGCFSRRSAVAPR
jgi:dihydroorotase